MSQSPEVPRPIQGAPHEEPREKRAGRRRSVYCYRPSRWVTGTTSGIGFAVEGV